MISNRFQGEQFLLYKLPDYTRYENFAIFIAVALVISFVFILPVTVAFYFRGIALQDFQNERAQSKNSQKRKSKQSKHLMKDQESKLFEEYLKIHRLEIEKKQDKYLGKLSPRLGGLCLIVLLSVFLCSPNNTRTARGVFQAPIFTEEECQQVIDMAHIAAKKNYEEALSLPEGSDENGADLLKKEPLGWRKLRHSNYPTTDLHVVIDPFIQEDRAFLQEILNARLAPLVSF